WTAARSSARATARCWRAAAHRRPARAPDPPRPRTAWPARPASATMGAASFQPPRERARGQGDVEAEPQRREQAGKVLAAAEATAAVQGVEREHGHAPLQRER